MKYILVATTRGDELIGPSTMVIAESSDRGKLEQLKDQRAKERTDWLARNSVPWWQECAIISEEHIQEIMEI